MPRRTPRVRGRARQARAASRPNTTANTTSSVTSSSSASGSQPEPEREDPAGLSTAEDGEPPADRAGGSGGHAGPAAPGTRVDQEPDVDGRPDVNAQPAASSGVRSDSRATARRWTGARQSPQNGNEDLEHCEHRDRDGCGRGRRALVPGRHRHERHVCLPQASGQPSSLDGTGGADPGSQLQQQRAEPTRRERHPDHDHHREVEQMPEHPESPTTPVVRPRISSTAW